MKSSACALALTAWVVAGTANAAGPPRVYDTERSYQALARLQNDLCAKRKSPTCEFTVEDCIKDLLGRWEASFGEKPDPAFVRKICSERPSVSRELPGVYPMLLGYYRDITAVLPDLGFTAPVEPALGSLPLEEVNATIQTDLDEPVRILAVNQGVFMLAGSMPKVAAYSLPRGERDGQRYMDFSLDGTLAKLQSDGRMAQFVGVLLTSLGLTFEPLPDALDIDQAIMAGYFQGVETFAVAHEVAHILSNHDAPSRGLFLEEGCRNVAGAQVVANSWIQEVEADLLAQRILNAIAARKRADVDENPIVRNTITLSPGYFFYLMEMRHETMSVLRTGRYPDGPTAEEEAALAIILRCIDEAGCDVRKALTHASSPVLNVQRHPSPAIRRRIVEHQASKSAGPDSEIERGGRQIAAAAYRNTQIMWTLAKDRLPQLYKVGVRMPPCGIEERAN